MSAQGVISESLASFKITWDNPGNGQQPKWDQNRQVIELHETDVYPDLIYTSAFAAPVYIKYNSASLLNDLLVAINKVIDTKLAATSSKKEKVNELYLNAGTDTKEDPQVNAGEEKPKEIIDTNVEVNNEPSVTPNDQESVTTTTTAAPQKVESSAYTVTVYGDKLRFLEGQEGRGAYSSGIKFLYKVSNNLTKQASGEQIDNRSKIWAEITSPGLLSKTTRFEFADFDEIEFKFGGNLLAQVLPSIELSFTPDPNSVYSKEKPELDIADVIKATNITLGTKTTSEIKSLQKQIQKEIESREPVEKQKQPGKQSDSTDNK